MAAWVVLLRGINVGPSTQMSMADLALAFADAGHPQVHTVLRSGNVVLSAPQAPAPDALEGAIAERTGVSARVLVLAASVFGEVARANPLRDGAEDLSKLATTFLDAPPPPDLAIEVLAPERLAVTERAVYQYSPAGLSRSSIPSGFWRRLGPVATTRNENTIVKLLALVDGIA